MAALFLSEADVESLLSMDMALAAIGNVLEKQAHGGVANIPRGRARTDQAMLHVMGAASKALGAMCSKVYASVRHGARFLVHLYDGDTGELLSVMEADRLGAVRTGAVSGLATRCMASKDANTVGVFGSGTQARTQLEAVCEVRSIVEAYVYSPTKKNRDKFANEMSAQLGIPVVGVSRPELVAEDKDIVVTATTSVNPVVLAEWISEGTHLNVIGSNFLRKAEVDLATVRTAEPIVVDDKESALREAGDLAQAVEEGVIRWTEVHELASVVVGNRPGRHRPEDITLFKSVGAAYQDLAVAQAVYRAALVEGVGTRLPY